jgi:dTDP-glucose 4,6-dehydratase/UDP-glucuronate decarboxylase
VNNFNFAPITKDCANLAERIDTSKLKNKTILVTGANGVIGGFLCDFLCFLNDSRNYSMNLIFTSRSSPSQVPRISHLLGRRDMRYFSWDCSESIPPGTISEGIDYVFFCSGYGQPSKFLDDKIKTISINVVGLESLLSTIVTQKRNSSFLFLSTSEIYGDPPNSAIPTPEDYNGAYDLDNNRSCYTLSKCLGEVICREYSSSNLDVKIARVALAYGPGTLRDDTRVLQNFIFKSYEKGEIQMLDGGESIRNYIYISDCVEVLLNCLLHGKSLTYNVGGDIEPVSVYDLAKMVASHFGVLAKKGKSHHDFIKTAPKRVALSMKKYREEFPSHGEHLTGLDRGIENIIRWYNMEANRQ